jgi:hypothetical protein
VTTCLVLDGVLWGGSAWISVEDLMMAHYNDLLVMKFKVSELPTISRSSSGWISFGAIWDITSKSTEPDVCGYIEGVLKI